MAKPGFNPTRPGNRPPPLAKHRDQVKRPVGKQLGELATKKVKSHLVARVFDGSVSPTRPKK